MNNSSSQRSCCSVRVFSQLGSVSQGRTYRISRLLYITLPSVLAPDMTILFAASCHFRNSQLTPILIRTSSISYSSNRGFVPWAGSEGLPGIGTMWQLTRISWWTDDQCLYSSMTCPLVWYGLSPASVAVCTWVCFWDIYLIVLVFESLCWGSIQWWLSFILLYFL